MFTFLSYHVNRMKGIFLLNKSVYIVQHEFMFISGDRRDERDRRVIICDVFFLEARVGSRVEVARVGRQRSSHV